MNAPVEPTLVPRLGDTQRPRILVMAYACDPTKGSEAGAGWGLVKSLSTFADCVVLVAPWYYDNLKQWLVKTALGGAEFVPVPAPRFSRIGRAHRILWFVVYLVWLRKARKVAERLHLKRPFDLAYHATVSIYWLPSPVWRLGIPSVWGPVGGGVTTPRSLWPVLGMRGLLDEFLDRAAIRLASLIPATRRTWQRASAILVQNEQTLARLPRRLRERAAVLNHVLFIESPSVTVVKRERFVAYVSPLERRKGPELAIRAMAHVPSDVRLRVAGDGPDRRRLERLTSRLGLSERVEFMGRVSREKVLRLLASARVAVFTGLREEGGLSLAEALFCGTAAIVLEIGGAGSVAREVLREDKVVLIPPSAPVEAATRLGGAIKRALANVSRETGPLLDQEGAIERLRTLVERTCTVLPAGPKSA